jgi:hypothetical protein
MTLVAVTISLPFDDWLPAVAGQFTGPLILDRFHEIALVVQRIPSVGLDAVLTNHCSLYALRPSVVVTMGNNDGAAFACTSPTPVGRQTSMTSVA